MKLFRNLTETETETFQQWARDHYKPGKPINGIWHPVVQEACVKMNQEAFRDSTLSLFIVE